MDEQRPQKKLRILVVDDEENVVHLLERALALFGHEVTVHTDACMGLTAACDQPFDLLIVDLEMPLLKGDQLIAALRRARTGDTPVIVFSAYCDKARAVRLWDLGVDTIIEKPAALGRILEAVASATDQGDGPEAA